MLDRAHRLSSPAHFRRVTRRGRRSQHGSVLCYVDLQERDNARFGFIVSKSVGNAVTRNLVKRRLRAIAHEHFPHIPADIVVRAMPNAGLVSAEQLAADMRLCLERIVEGRS